MCGKIMTVLLIFVYIVLNCSMARYNGRLHCIVGVLPTCYKRKAATYFYPPGGTGPLLLAIIICSTIFVLMVSGKDFNYG